jgi:hypothetical protein
MGLMAQGGSSGPPMIFIVLMQSMDKNKTNKKNFTKIDQPVPELLADKGWASWPTLGGTLLKYIIHVIKS